MEALGATSLEEGAYQNGYSSIAKLHIINEMEQIDKLINQIIAKSDNRKACTTFIEQMIEEWGLRLKVINTFKALIDFLLPVIADRSRISENT